MAATITIIISALTVIGAILIINRQKRNFAQERSELTQLLTARSEEIATCKNLLAKAEEKAATTEKNSERISRELKNATQIKEHLMSNMTHELRTPMNGVLGMIGLALNTDLSQNQRNFMEMAQTSAKRLMDAINDLLDFSKLETGKLELFEEVFNLHQSLDGMLEPMLTQAHQKDLKLDCYIHPDVPELLIGDVNRLLQVIINLVQNALNNTRKGEITIEVGAEKQLANQEISLSFQVKDTGIGVPDERRQQIFQLFTTSNRTYTRQYHGSGLGLSICSQLVKMMGGELNLESKPDVGSCFSFNTVFSIAPDILHEEAPSISANSKSRQKLFNELNILLVEDDHINRVLIQAILDEYNLNITFAENGQDAVHLVSEQYFDVILMDLQMPVLNGFDATQKIRANNSKNHVVPIIALSAYAQEEEKQKCLDAGMDDYVCKPLVAEELYVTLERQLLKKALVIDENFISQRVAVRILTERGWKVLSATTPKQALRTASRNKFDMVIFDVNMSEANVFSFTNELRNLIQPHNHSQKYTAIFAATLSKGQAEEETYLAAGMDGFITKPFTEEKIAEIIHRTNQLRTERSKGSETENGYRLAAI